MTKETTDKLSKTRVYYLDILRAFACLAVVMIHVSASYATTDVGTFNYWVGNIFDGLVRFGVPIFVMISGSLLLDENYKFDKKKNLQRILRLIIFFFSWSALYAIVFYVVTPMAEGKPIGIIQALTSFITGYYHLWYIPMCIGLYLITPLLRLWVKEKNKKQVEYFLILALFFTFIIPQIITIGLQITSKGTILNQILESLNALDVKFMLQFVGGYTAYYILGWYLNSYTFKREKLIYTLGIVGVLITILGTGLISIHEGTSIRLYSEFYVNVLLSSVALFVFIKNKFHKPKKDKKENKLILALSKYSLGIYAVHVLIINYAYDLLKNFNSDIALIKIPIVFIIATVVSFLICFILKKMPGLKRIV